jgi:hypothetical protein
MVTLFLTYYGYNLIPTLFFFTSHRYQLVLSFVVQVLVSILLYPYGGLPSTTSKLQLEASKDDACYYGGETQPFPNWSPLHHTSKNTRKKKNPSKDMSKRPPPYFNGKREIAVNSRSSTTREIRNSNSHQLKLVQGIYHNIWKEANSLQHTSGAYVMSKEDAFSCK